MDDAPHPGRFLPKGKISIHQGIRELFDPILHIDARIGGLEVREWNGALVLRARSCSGRTCSCSRHSFRGGKNANRSAVSEKIAR